MTIKPVYHDCYIFGLVIKKKNSLLRIGMRRHLASFLKWEMGGGDADLKKNPYTPIFKTLIHGGEIVLE